MALQDLLAGLPEVGGHEEDPLVTGLAKQAELQRMRSEASQARWAECQDHKLWLAEKNWRKQVRKTKEDERRRKAEEAARAEAERRAEEERKRRAKIPELSPAEKAEAEAKAARAKLLMEAKIRWLSEEWQPMFQQRKQEVQAQRLDAEERVRREKAAEEDRKNYECGGMEAEDVRVRQREAFLSAECERLAKRAQTPRVQEAIEKKIELVLEMRGLEIRWKQNLEKRRLEEQQALLALQEERKERDYREWRSEVQEERLRRRRLIAREEAQEKELLEWKTLELLGRDVLREEELKKKAAVEAAFQKSSVQRRQLEEQGILPSRVLQEAKVLAEEQRKTMEQVGPKQAEQELWDALMAKNRWARTQQMGSTHPTSREVSRWGFFAEKADRSPAVRR